MLVTVTPNAAIDHTSFVAQLKEGHRHVAVAERRQAGGKGVNVARVAAVLGADSRPIVVVGGRTGMEIQRELQTTGMHPVIVQAPGESRTCVEILDEASGAATQVHGGGVIADDDTAHALLSAVRSRLAGASWLALCGSLPRGMPVDLYARLVRLGHDGGVRVAVDASGDALIAALREGPDVVRINREEESVLRGQAAPDGRALDESALLYVVSNGPREIAVRSADGRRWAIAPPQIDVRNPIGCGDAMLAALLTRIDALDLTDALRFATAVASASAETRYVGEVDLARVRALVARVRECALAGPA